jgi:carbon monoxide dehydrogenase subunit G
MESVYASIKVNAPPERVFDLLADLSTRPAFTDHFMQELRVERIPTDGVGAAARLQTGPRRNRIWMETVIGAVDRPAKIEEQGHGGRSDRIPIFTTWELATVSGPRTEINVSFRTEPAGRLDRMKELGSRPWYRRRWSRALRRLKKIVETQAPPERIKIAGGDRVPIT